LKTKTPAYKFKEYGIVHLKVALLFEGLYILIKLRFEKRKGEK
jgi:hypothetical protein